MDSGVFHRLSKLCKKRSFGLHSIDNPKLTHDSYAEESETGVEACDWKIHPQPLEEKLDAESEQLSEEATVLKLFAAISALKLAYIQLQQALLPYEPKKLRAADELMSFELDSLSKLESLYIGKFSLCLEIQKHEKWLEQLQFQLQSKDSEVMRLRHGVEELNRKNAELEEEVKKKAPVAEEAFILLNREWTPSLFSNACRLTSKAIHDFTKLLISLMKASCWDLDRAADCIDSSFVYSERSHKKFAFESYLALIMLYSAEDECFRIDHFDCVMKFSDPFDALVQYPDSDFGRFCRLKYEVAVKAKMECSFFGNLDQREFVLGGGHPRTPFYQAFVRMARWVWALQVMACSFIPKAEMFYAKRWAKFDEECMESVVALPLTGGVERAEVGLTVMPGFKIGSYVVRCRVYRCKMKFPREFFFEPMQL